LYFRWFLSHSSSQGQSNVLGYRWLTPRHLHRQCLISGQTLKMPGGKRQIWWPSECENWQSHISSNSKSLLGICLWKEKDETAFENQWFE
jgi:hypothetical protein